MLNLIPDKAAACSRSTSRAPNGIIQLGKESNILGSVVIKGALTHTCRRNNKLANPEQLISTALQIKEICADSTKFMALISEGRAV